MSKAKKINLVISVVGDNSYHKLWGKPFGRDFDLMLIYYGARTGIYKRDAEHYFEIQGLFKMGSIAEAINRSLDVVKQYKAVFLPDDDLIMGAGEINSLFKLFYKYNLDVAAPAVVSQSKINHVITKQVDNCVLRYVNFIEMMAPLFKTEILLANLYTFTLNKSGWGIDFLWSKYLKDKKLAIIDTVAVYHGKNKKFPEGEYYKKLDELGVSAQEELRQICRQYDCDFIGKTTEYSRITMSMPARLTAHIRKPLTRIYYSIKIKGLLQTIKSAIMKICRKMRPQATLQ